MPILREGHGDRARRRRSRAAAGRRTRRAGPLRRGSCAWDGEYSRGPPPATTSIATSPAGQRSRRRLLDLGCGEDGLGLSLMLCPTVPMRNQRTDPCGSPKLVNKPTENPHEEVNQQSRSPSNEAQQVEHAERHGRNSRSSSSTAFWLLPSSWDCWARGLRGRPATPRLRPAGRTILTVSRRPTHTPR